MKQRASMNRTISLSDEEITIVAPKIDHVFIENKNQVIQGDFNEINKNIPDQYFDLIIIDPPYNLTKKYGENTFKTMSDDEYIEYSLLIFKKCLRKLKPTGTMYVCGDWKTSYLQRRALEYCENDMLCDVINRITWARDKGRGSMNNWKNNIEDIYMVVKDKSNYYFDVESVKIQKKVLAPYKDKNGNNKDWEYTEEGKLRMSYPSNIWFDITVPFWSMPENTDHPTQKSEKLFAKLILASSKIGDKIYEPFAGVCTGGVVANKLGRNYTCVEFEHEYCEIGQYRIDKSEIDKTIQGYEDGIFRDK